MKTTQVAIIISSISFLVSAISLWFSHLKPFKLSVKNSGPRLSMYMIKDDNDEVLHWIPSFDLTLTFLNLGKMAGSVNDIRLVGEFITKDGKEKVCFYPEYVVDYAEFNQSKNDRSQWLKGAVVGGWYPVCIRGQGDVSMHIIFEKRGQSMIFKSKKIGEMSLNLEVSHSRTKQWESIATYEASVPDIIYNQNTTLSYQNPELEPLRRNV